MSKPGGGKSYLIRSSTEEDRALLWNYAKICLIVALYWFVSITMVFLNKQILAGSAYSIDAPLFITWFQCVFTVGITLVGSGLMSTFSSTSKESSGYHALQVRFRWKTARQILPLSLVFVAMISFNNLCLKNVGVAFYFVGRSLTTVFNVALTFMILRKRTSPSAIACCLAIVLGFLLGVDQEQLIGTLSVSGVVYGVLASLFVSLNSIFTVNALTAASNSIWLLTFYNNVIACGLFIPLMILNGEFEIIFSSGHLFTNPIFWSVMSAAGVFGFSIGYVTNLQIKYTSPLTHNISGTAKACAQTVLATYFYQEEKTFSWWLSNAVVLGASACYTRVKQLEMKSAAMERTKHETASDCEEALVDSSRKNIKTESI